MKYLNNAVQFFLKFYILAVPLFILNALSALISNKGTSNTFKNFTDMMGNFGSMERFRDPGFVFSMLPAFFAIVVGAGFLAIILKFVAEPATYGMVNKALQIGMADLNDFSYSLKENFVKYLLYWIGTIIVSIVFGIAFLIVLLIFGLLAALLKWLGALIFVIAVLAMIFAGIILFVLISLWFPAMVVDNMDVMSGLKRSIEIVRSNFRTIVGITLLISIASFVVSGMLSLIIGWIPVIGPVVLSVVPTAQAFITIVFLLMLYRDKTSAGMM